MFKTLAKRLQQPRSKYLVNFKDPELGIKNLITGCDEDMGGFSTVKLETIKESEDHVYGRFKGDLSLDLPEDRPDIVRLGYSGFRTKNIPVPYFGLGDERFIDLSQFNQLALRVRGDYRKYFINVQASTPVVSDLYQHRLFLKTPGEWETVTVAFSNFILTNVGIIQRQDPLEVQSVRSVGISLIDGQYGPYKLDVDWIKAVAGPLPAEKEAKPLSVSTETSMGPIAQLDSSKPSDKKIVKGKRLSVDD